MIFNINAILLFAAAVSARAILPRTTAQILADLKGIDTSTNALTASVNSWDGTLLGSLNIESSANNLENQINAANTDAQGQPVESSADSKTIIAFITGTLEPDIEKSLTALEARKAQFVAVGEQSLVVTTLQTLQTDTNNYSASLQKIASSDQKTAAAAIAAKINADFNAAIADFS